MKYIFSILLVPFMVSFTQAQTDDKSQNSVDLGLAFGKSQSSFAGAFTHNWFLGKKNKFVIGLGGRFTSYIGQNQYYATAPAEITSGSTGLGVIFKENITDNIDSLLISKPTVFSLNGLINLGYRFNEKFSVGFNIDAIGFSFGSKRDGHYINGSHGQNGVSSKPTSFNLLLTSDNDLGSLNSELYGRYMINDKWAIRSGLQFLFTEYTTSTNVQQAPQANDRFRNKALMFMIGTTFKLQ